MYFFRTGSYVDTLDTDWLEVDAAVSVSVTQTMAKHYCGVLGGSLATIKDASQQTEIINNR